MDALICEIRRRAAREAAILRAIRAIVWVAAVLTVALVARTVYEWRAFTVE